jgi:hypothetical protein
MLYVGSVIDVGKIVAAIATNGGRKEGRKEGRR